MNNHTEELNEAGTRLSDDAQALLDATTHVAGEKVADARKRLASAIAKGKETLQYVQQSAIAGAKASDKAIRTHPYQSIGVALGVGALVGYLLARRK